MIWRRRDDDRSRANPRMDWLFRRQRRSLSTGESGGGFHKNAETIENSGQFHRVSRSFEPRIQLSRAFITYRQIRILPRRHHSQTAIFEHVAASNSVGVRAAGISRDAGCSSDGRNHADRRHVRNRHGLHIRRVALAAASPSAAIVFRAIQGRESAPCTLRSSCMRVRQSRWPAGWRRAITKKSIA